MSLRTAGRSPTEPWRPHDSWPRRRRDSIHLKRWSAPQPGSRHVRGSLSMSSVRPPRVVPALAVLALLASLAGAPVQAQVFGKNKVQYEPLDWNVLETAHLRLHF